jgi:DNA-binding NarL/FixJ family response regulator
MKPIDHQHRPQSSPVQILDQPGIRSASSRSFSRPVVLREPRIGSFAPIRTLVINDSLGLLFEISRLLMTQSQIDVIGMISDEGSVWNEMESLQPKLIVWTLQTRRRERLEKIRALRRLLPFLRIVIIGAQDRPVIAARCQELGVDSFVPKSRLRFDLWPSIQRHFSR